MVVHKKFECELLYFDRQMEILRLHGVQLLYQLLNS